MLPNSRCVRRLSDSKRLAYPGKAEYAWFAIADEKEGKPYDASVDFNRWVVFDAVDSFHYLALKDDSIYLVEEKILENTGQQPKAAPATRRTT